MHTSLYGWFIKNLRGKKGQQGFTLIELLVVVTILGILAAIVTLSLVGLTTNANAQACNTEYRTVQAAMDAYMADTQSASVTAETNWTNDMTNHTIGTVNGNTNNGTVPLWISNPSSTSPNYTRNGTTQFFYTWDSAGKINGIAIDKNGTPMPNNACVPK